MESTPGVGSRFIVPIPMGTLRTVCCPPTRAGGEEALGFSARILLADDGPDNRRMIALLLKKAGGEVDVAENGQQAIELALEAHRNGRAYDVILMDMVMPEKDGLTATRQLREAGYRAPIVALTANTGSGARQECLAAAAPQASASRMSGR